MAKISRENFGFFSAAVSALDAYRIVMDLLGQANQESKGKTKDTELAKAMYEGTKEFRKKLKMPEIVLPECLGSIHGSVN